MRRERIVLLVVWFACAAAAFGAKARVCITPLDNNTGRNTHDDTTAALTDALIAVVSQSDVSVVERRRYDAVLRERGLDVAGLTDANKARKLGRLFEADRVITGGVVRAAAGGSEGNGQTDGERLRATLQVWAVEGGRLIGSVEASASPNELLALTSNLADKLEKPLDASLIAPASDELADSPYAGLHYLRGLGYMHAGNYDRALLAFFRTTDLAPHHERAYLMRARCYRQLEEYNHAIIELKKFVEQFPESRRLPKVKKRLSALRREREGPPPTLRATTQPRREGELPEKPVFAKEARQGGDLPTIALLPTQRFNERYEARPFAKLIRERIGVSVKVLSVQNAPQVKPLDGHALIKQADALWKRIDAGHPEADRLLVLTQAALEQKRTNIVTSERWPKRGQPRVIVASNLWLHMSPPPDLSKVNEHAPPMPEHPEFYNFVLGAAGRLLGSGDCDTFGCPVNQRWYLWDQRYYDSWLCQQCRAALTGS
jgi:tetratricopeptide (TPR) repeat protein